MGKDKVLLTLQGKTLLQRAWEAAAAVTEAIWIVGDAPRLRSFGRVVEDEFAECGPLGGIHSALKQSASALNLILAVDMPFVEHRFLRYLISTAGESDAVVTVARAEGAWQPLCAVYRQGFAEVAECALRGGRNRIDALFAQVRTRVIEEEELARLGFSTRMFRNLNTPEDFALAEKDMLVTTERRPPAAERNQP